MVERKKQSGALHRDSKDLTNHALPDQAKSSMLPHKNETSGLSSPQAGKRS